MKFVGRYEIVRKLGQGGMGAVYEAYDPQIQRKVAIKVISATMVDRPDLRERFFREARAAGQLSHKNLITVYDLGEHEGQPYIAMEYLDGVDLAARMQQEDGLTLPAKLQIVSEICEGLAYAHERGIVHRDIKPANVMVVTDGHIKILDFGLARLVTSDLTRSNTMFGTMEYMAPEQIRAEPVDHRADIFSVGALFYELLSGRRAFSGDTFAATMYKILQEVPQPLRELGADLPPHVCAIVERAIAKSRAERYQTMGEMLRAVRLAQQSLEGGSRPYEAAYVPGQSPAPMTPPDAPTMELPSGQGTPPPSPPGAYATPGTPAPGTPVPGTPAPATPPPAPAMRRVPLLAISAVALVLVAGLAWWIGSRSPAPPPNQAAVAEQTAAGEDPGATSGSPPSQPADENLEDESDQEPADEPEAVVETPPAPAPPPPAPPQPTPPAPDPAARRRADAAQSQMTEAKQAAESDKAPDLAPQLYSTAAQREREGRRSYARGNYLEAIGQLSDARTQYLLAAAEARRQAAAREQESRSAAARQAAADRLPRLREAWNQARSGAERAGAPEVASEQFDAAQQRAREAEAAAAKNDPQSAAVGFAEAAVLAQRARQAALDARPPEPIPAPAPAPPPKPVPVENATAAIEGLMQRYVAALEARDIGALKRVWPSLSGGSERQFRQQFDDARSIQVSMESPRIESNGDQGQIIATRVYQVQTRDDQRLTSRSRTIITVRRNEGRWIIESIRFEPLR